MTDTTQVEHLLTQYRNDAILFCGAGFTADCLNFVGNEVIGAGVHLTKIMNDELQKQGKRNGYRDLKNASRAFKKEIGVHKLMKMLEERFDISRISESIENITRYPWKKIYTTNYDNGIEKGLIQNKIPFRSLDKENFREYIESDERKTHIIHLHGFIETWDSTSFEEKCVIDTSSYYKTDTMKELLHHLRHDIERTNLVVFIGFNASDFHLDQVFFNATGLKEKAYFINRITPDIDPDVDMTQREFGCPLYIGRDKFSQIISDSLAHEQSEELVLHSFRRIETYKESNSVPRIKDIEDLFIWGKINFDHMKRDLTFQRSDYHVIRNESTIIKEYLQKPRSIIFLHGEICSGKTIIIRDSINSFYGSRPIFILYHAYSDLLKEVEEILSRQSKAIFVIENAFSLNKETLINIIMRINTSEANLIISSRTISTEGDSSKLQAIRQNIPNDHLQEIQIGKITSSEVKQLTKLIDQIAGWKYFRGLSENARIKFIENTCEGNIPNILISLLESKYVEDKYKEEYNKISFKNDHEKYSIIGVLLIANIGMEVFPDLISSIFMVDIRHVIKKISRDNSTFNLVSIVGNEIKTIPSIGARNMLKKIISDKDCINTVIYILEELSIQKYMDEDVLHIFHQLMRYSILESFVSDHDEIDRFFSHIAKIDYFRKMPLFWLQWHMAMTKQKKWSKAKDYLEMGYRRADAYDIRNTHKYNRKQLDDRKAKLLIEEVMDDSNIDQYNIMKSLKEALPIISKLMSQHYLSHHPFSTLKSASELLKNKHIYLEKHQKDMFIKSIQKLCKAAEKKISNISEENQRRIASTYIKDINQILDDFCDNT